MKNPAPRLMLTRPMAASRRIAQSIAATGLALPDILISPVLTIVPIGPDPDLDGIEGVVLTSAHAVERLGPAPARMIAYCVGKSTAAAARAKGFHTLVSGGDADVLVADILARGPKGPLLHLRGTHSRGDIAARLMSAGVICQEQIVYQQVAQSLTDEARAALAKSGPIVLPLFSPRSADLVAAQGPFAAPLHVVAMSAAVAQAAKPLQPARIDSAAQPASAAMIDAILAALGAYRAG